MLITFALALFAGSVYVGDYATHPKFTWCVIGGLGVLDLAFWCILFKGRQAVVVPPKLRIVSANYRAYVDGGRTFDVRECLQEMIKGDTLALDIENHNFQVNGKNYAQKDPFEYKAKRLRVQYEFDGKGPYLVERPEHKRIVLPEDTFLTDQIEEFRRERELEKKPVEEGLSTPQSSTITLGIPALSSLLGQNSTTSFDPKKYFAQAYYSPITAEIESTIKVLANQYYPNEREAFYERLIGVGTVAFHHELTWTLIYRSQLAAMEELGARGLIPVTELQKHYDEAAKKYPYRYQKYSLENWLRFMSSRILIARYPSDAKYPSEMVELSWNGKDFLKYLAHTGYIINVKEY